MMSKIMSQVIKPLKETMLYQIWLIAFVGANVIKIYNEGGSIGLILIGVIIVAVESAHIILSYTIDRKETG